MKFIKVSAALLCGAVLCASCAFAQGQKPVSVDKVAVSTEIPEPTKLFSKKLAGEVLSVTISEDGSKIFASDDAGYLYCFDKNGTELWKIAYIKDVVNTHAVWDVDTGNHTYPTFKAAKEAFASIPRSNIDTFSSATLQNLPSSRLNNIIINEPGTRLVTRLYVPIMQVYRYSKFDRNTGNSVDGKWRKIYHVPCYVVTFSSDGKVLSEIPWAGEGQFAPDSNSILLYPAHFDDGCTGDEYALFSASGTEQWRYKDSGDPNRRSDNASSSPDRACVSYYAKYDNSGIVTSTRRYDKDGKIIYSIKDNTQAIVASCENYMVIQKPTGEYSEETGYGYTYHLYDLLANKEVMSSQEYRCDFTCTDKTIFLNGQMYDRKTLKILPSQEVPHVKDFSEWTKFSDHLYFGGFRKGAAMYDMEKNKMIWRLNFPMDTPYGIGKDKFFLILGNSFNIYAVGD